MKKNNGRSKAPSIIFCWSFNQFCLDDYTINAPTSAKIA